MKVIQGKFKKKSLKVPLGIRQTSLRIKKSIFDILSGELEGSKILDLFAGSGALGIEALSLGAKAAVFVDISSSNNRFIRENIASLKLTSQSDILVKDGPGAIKDFYQKANKFNIIFIDPPYYKAMAKKTLQTLDEYDIVGDSGYIVVLSSHKEEYKEEYKSFDLILTKNYGQSRLLIYRKK